MIGMSIPVLQKGFEKSNHLSSMLPERGTDEINVALFETSKKKKAGTTKATITTKIRV